MTVANSVAKFIGGLQDEYTKSAILREKAIADAKNYRLVADAETQQELVRREKIFRSEMQKLDLKLENDVERYKEFLGTFGILKKDLMSRFSGMNVVLGHLIYNELCERLDSYWHTTKVEEKHPLREKMINLMLAVQHDLALAKSGNDYPTPELTLSVIKE